MSTLSSPSAPSVVLGIETSCDETGVAIVSADRMILAEKLSSQLDKHAPFGGVVPEIAARAHLDILDVMIDEVMSEAALSFLGLGMPVTRPSLGSLIRAGQEYFFSGSWWITVFPGIWLVVFVLVINLLGDWLRDVLNPKLYKG